MLMSFHCHGPKAKALPEILQLSADEVKTIPLPFGKASLFFPVYSDEAVECCLLLEVAPELLPREAPYLGTGQPIQAYVHARQWTNTALMGIALTKAFGALPAQNEPQDLEIFLPALTTKATHSTLEAWFEPLGYELPGISLEGNASGCIDLRLKCSLPLPQVIDRLPALLCALDQDHIQWLGREQTLAIAAQAAAWLETHPTGAEIHHAILSGPYIGNRNLRAGLVEPHDPFHPPHPSHFYLNPIEAAEIALAITQKVEDLGLSNALVIMPEGQDLIESLASSPKLGRVLAIDLHMERLQHVLRHLNQSTVSVDAKRKMSLLPLSPLYHSHLLQESDVIIAEGCLHKFPKHNLPALEENMFRHCKAKAVVVVQRMHRDFKAWAEATSKAYAFDVKIEVPKISDAPKAPPLAIAVFTPSSTH